MRNQWTLGKLNRMVADLKEIEQHLMNVAKIDDESGARYKEAASKLNTAMYKVKGIRTLCARMRKYVTMMGKIKGDNTQIDQPVKAYSYAATLVNDVIQEYCT